MAEFDWIERYLMPIANSPGAMGLKNDVGVLDDSAGSKQIVTMDTLVEGIHFLSRDPVETVASKLVRVNVSDILAKGGVPVEAVLSIAWPQSAKEDAFSSFSRGLKTELANWDIALIGGDTVRTSGPLLLTLTLVGKCGPKGPVCRSGASPGDQLYVTGSIGAGFLGLRDARHIPPGRMAAGYWKPDIPPLEASHLVSNFATASIDVSDGLLADAGHIQRQSGVGLVLELSDVPWITKPTSVEEMIQLATAGDDYQILFTVAPCDVAACLAFAEDNQIRLSRAGWIDDQPSMRLQHLKTNIPVPSLKGYQH